MRFEKTGLLLAVVLFISTGCHHPISFHEIGYTIHNDLHDSSLVVVIDPKTLDATVSIRSFMTGIAHRWDAKPGIMLRQIADVEFPQMFKEYTLSETADQTGDGTGQLTLELTVPEYIFAKFKATVTVRAVAYRPEKKIVLDRTYTQEGRSQGGKMFNAGAFGMKSAVRQSSFDAYKKIFALLRDDLNKSLAR